MSAKRIVIGQSEFTFPQEDVADVLGQIASALRDATVLQLSLLDAQGRAVTVHLNGRAVPTVVVDLGRSARPSEIS